MNFVFRKIVFIVFLAFLLVCIADKSYASVTSGTISSSNYKAILLKDSSTINFGYFTTATSANATVTDSALSGYAWSEKTGWIVLNCVNTASGCSATNGNFKVANNGYGNLSGYAWGQNTGWINFGPFTNTSISRVKIATDGKFGGTLSADGYAWSENMGWLKFDCSSALSCTQTDWRPISARALCNNTLVKSVFHINKV